MWALHRIALLKTNDHDYIACHWFGVLGATGHFAIAETRLHVYLHRVSISIAAGSSRRSAFDHADMCAAATGRPAGIGKARLHEPTSREARPRRAEANLISFKPSSAQSRVCLITQLRAQKQANMSAVLTVHSISHIGARSCYLHRTS